MLKYVILLVIVTTAHSKDTGQKLEDQLLTALDRGLTHTLAYHYLWPFSQLVRAAAEADEGLELLQIQSDDKKYEIDLNVRKFQPDELKVKVKNHYVIVEGKHKEMYAQRPILTNHFMQRFALPAGSKPEEVTAVLSEKGILSVSAPKHKLPPPPPEREVPIEVRVPLESTSTEKTTVDTEADDEVTEKGEVGATEEQNITKEKKDNITKKHTKLEDKEIVKSTESPLWQHLMESTTHVGKIRKKELKSTTKVVKENEVTKDGEGNNLDFDIDMQIEE
ncbi:protein lethal(2)essential for life-like [Amyelois transitella]|uniref:protein lethal(2)essential for life-like n=1 Tax=Amyelois transitella TaxID=680683 RepID=UPI00299035A0|nr:protein lethal(2)essential for life-like [Amyelois transitella]